MSLPTGKQDRKERPIASGVLSYFPDAIAEVAHVSYVGNQQHNPGQPMHWARHKSTDHRDCIARHLMESGTIDDDGLRHTAKAAWRALALLQIELEEAASNTSIKNTFQSFCGFPVEFVDKLPETPASRLEGQFVNLGCPSTTAKEIIGGMTLFNSVVTPTQGWIYIAGPMRGYEKFNFPAFDKARDQFLAKGFNVISPADIDRATHPNADDPTKVDTTDQTRFALRDFWSLYFIRKQQGTNGIALLPHWFKSTGASAEFFLARWLGLNVFDHDGEPFGTEAALTEFAFNNG